MSRTLVHSRIGLDSAAGTADVPAMAEASRCRTLAHGWIGLNSVTVLGDVLPWRKQVGHSPTAGLGFVVDIPAMVKARSSDTGQGSLLYVEMEG